MRGCFDMHIIFLSSFYTFSVFDLSSIKINLKLLSIKFIRFISHKINFYLPIPVSFHVSMLLNKTYLRLHIAVRIIGLVEKFPDDDIVRSLSCKVKNWLHWILILSLEIYCAQNVRRRIHKVPRRPRKFLKQKMLSDPNQKLCEDSDTIGI